MTAWESIQITLDWIEEHAAEDISVDQLAQQAHLSQFYYQRLFSRLVGRSVMEYVRLRRLAKAADRLAQRGGKILDTALQHGFGSHEGFTRAFRDAYGVTPEDYRAQPRQLSHFNKPDLSMRYYLVDENVPLAAEGIILEVRRFPLHAPRHFIGLTVQNPISFTPGIDHLGELWDTLHRRKEEIPHLLPQGSELGMSSAGEKEGCFTYFAGAETSCGSPVPGDLRHTEIPAGDYIVCSFEAENFYQLTTDALDKARDYLLGVWLPNHKITIDPFMAELYGKTDPEATSMEIWLKSAGSDVV